MTKWFGAAIVILILTGGAAATIRPTAAASISAERRLERARERLFPRRDRFAYRLEAQPRYYGRPIYYVPAPFVPLPPLSGYGWEPW
jgi:hypothetical protein